MKKYALSLLAILGVLFSLNIGTVEAKSCTGQKPAPYMYEVAPAVKGTTFNLKTADTVCKGSNTEVWFNAFRALPTTTAAKDGVIYVSLWEEDPVGNDDERVKHYMGLFYNRIITEFYVDYTDAMGNIDSQGDQTCELYLKFEGVTGEPYRAIQATLFDYNICMN